MGMVVSFTRVTAEQLAKAEQDPEWAEELLEELAEPEDEDEPDGYLDKAWAGIQYLMEAEGLGIDLLMDGDSLDEDGTLFGWSVAHVRQVAEKLRAAPWERLAAHYDAEKMMAAEVYPRVWDTGDDERDYVEGYYQGLVEFFAFAAAKQSAAIMEFSF